MDILRVVLVSAVCAIICLVLKQYRPEFVPFLQISSLLLILTLIYDSIRELLDSMTDLLSESGSAVYDEYIFLLIRVLGIAFITKVGTEVCKDSGNGILSVIIEFSGKLVILLMCFPLLKTVVQLANGMLK